MTHNKNCHLGDNWKDCHACVEAFCSVSTREEIDEANIAATIAEIHAQDGWWEQGFRYGLKSQINPFRDIQERWNDWVLKKRTMTFEQFWNWRKGYDAAR